VDKLLIILFVAAMLAVLGLVPLWRAVYERYSAPPALPTPGSERWPAPDPGDAMHDLAIVQDEIWYGPEFSSGLIQGSPWARGLVHQGTPLGAFEMWPGVVRSQGASGSGAILYLSGPPAELDARVILWYNKESSQSPSRS